LNIWDSQLVSFGGKIIERRIAFVDQLNEIINDIHKKLSGGKEDLKIIYDPDVTQEAFEESLWRNQERDIRLKMTSVGPHRDDISFNINNISARSFGSQGQKRSVALSLKLAGAEVIKEISGEYPICLLDDVMSELDENRQNYILNHIKGWQSFITCCDTSNIKNLKTGKVITIRSGGVI
jgi:DNA replication and repair protein RecF